MPSMRHAPRTAALLALFVIACAAIALRYAIPGEFFTRPSQSHTVAAPANSALSPAMPNREALAISPERNAGIRKSVLAVFAPALGPFLTAVPIVVDASADTAKAYPSKGYIGVSPDWDRTVRQSRYRAIYERRGLQPDQPVFTDRFKTNLLIHEYLHLLQIRLAIDSPAFYAAVARWYVDSRYGKPSPRGTVGAETTADSRLGTLAINRMKYVLWHALYNDRKLAEVPPDGSWQTMEYTERYRSAAKGVEEFAYIGEEILASGSGSDQYLKTGEWSDQDWQSKKARLREVSPELVAIFGAVFNPAVLR